MNDRKARQVAGVRDVVNCDTAVAVIADHQGAAKKVLAALEVQWDEGASADFSSKAWADQLAFLKEVLAPDYDRSRRVQLYAADSAADYDFTRNVRRE